MNILVTPALTLYVSYCPQVVGYVPACHTSVVPKDFTLAASVFQTGGIENFPGSRIGFLDKVSFQRLERQRGRNERGRSIECQLTQSIHQTRTNLVLSREQVPSFSPFWPL